MSAAAGWTASLDATLRAGGTAERAADQKRYLKSDLTFYGVTVPKIRNVAKQFERSEPDLSREDLRALVGELWSEPVNERRFLAIILLDSYEPLLEDADVALIERFLRESRTWALVDPLATGAASTLLERHVGSDGIVESWAVDDDLWIRRAALLVHLIPLRYGRGDFERYGRIADPMLEEREFFIRKAIGWVLRDMSRRDPDAVYAWFLPRAHRASGVTMREVVKHLSAEQAEAIVCAYEEGK